jgi:hypothetical protein
MYASDFASVSFSLKNRGLRINHTSAGDHRVNRLFEGGRVNPKSFDFKVSQAIP